MQQSVPFLEKGKKPDEENLAIAKEAVKKAKSLINDETVDILILDEICNAIYFDLVAESEVLKLIVNKRTDMELIMTGRNATQSLIKEADLVTEMKLIKHPYQKGINSRRGIEY